MNDRYETVVGLEVHVELKTATKAFCSCPTFFGDEPNTNVCPVCLGMPGALPSLNCKAVELALRAALAFGCEIPDMMWFDRKNYFYPDLPKGYQITQFEKPIALGGAVPIRTENGTKRIRLVRIHIEEDAGKLIHRGDKTLIDCNRCGVPLIEIVSEPDMRSSDEAKAYLDSLRRILSYLGVSDCKMNEGSLRCDINVSVRKKGAKRFGTKVELKNLNSVAYAGKAIDFETERQISLLERGLPVESETRRYNEKTGETELMRKKETQTDYRYFNEPDIPPVILTETFVRNVKNSMPEMPDEAAARLMEKYALRPEDADMITASPETVREFLSYAESTEHTGECISLYFSEILSPADGIPKRIDPVYFGKICRMAAEKKIVSGVARKLVSMCFEENTDPEMIAERERLIKITDPAVIEGYVRRAMETYPNAVADFKRGKTAAVKQIVGAVMRESRGGADPILTEKTAIELMK